MFQSFENALTLFQDLFKKETSKYYDLIQRFLDHKDPKAIFFYYQRPFKKQNPGENENFEIEEGVQPEWYVTDGHQGGKDIKLVGRALYFVKIDPTKKVNKSSGNDDNILFGEVSESSINALNMLMTGIFRPLVSQLETNVWGHCEEEQKKEFLSSFEKFNKELGDAITSINEKKKLE